MSKGNEFHKAVEFSIKQFSAHKAALSGLIQYLVTESPSKIMKDISIFN